MLPAPAALHNSRTPKTEPGPDTNLFKLTLPFSAKPRHGSKIPNSGIGRWHSAGEQPLPPRGHRVPRGGGCIPGVSQGSWLTMCSCFHGYVPLSDDDPCLQPNMAPQHSNSASRTRPTLQNPMKDVIARNPDVPSAFRL